MSPRPECACSSCRSYRAAIAAGVSYSKWVDEAIAMRLAAEEAEATS